MKIQISCGLNVRDKNAAIKVIEFNHSSVLFNNIILLSLFKVYVQYLRSDMERIESQSAFVLVNIKWNVWDIIRLDISSLVTRFLAYLKTICFFLSSIQSKKLSRIESLDLIYPIKFILKHSTYNASVNVLPILAYLYKRLLKSDIRYCLKAGWTWTVQLGKNGHR